MKLNLSTNDTKMSKFIINMNQVHIQVNFMNIEFVFVVFHKRFFPITVYSKITLVYSCINSNSCLTVSR